MSELTPEKIDEGLFPQLGGEHIHIGCDDRCDCSPKETHDIHVIEMGVFYSKELNRKLSPIYGLLSGTTKDVNIQDLLNVEKIENALSGLADIAYYIVQRSGNNMSREYFEKHASEQLMIKLIRAQFEVNGSINFIKDILTGLVGMMAGTFKMSNEN